MKVIDLIVEYRKCSKSEAKQLIKQGVAKWKPEIQGLKTSYQTIVDWDLEIGVSGLLRIGGKFPVGVKIKGLNFKYYEK